jgi:KDO2-lipid IV(A) lauroyltransferase
MSRKQNKALDKLTVLAFGFGQKLFLHRDIAKVERRGARLGELAFKLDKKHRHRTLENLALAFPDWSESKRMEVGREVFRHFGIATADFLRTPLRTEEEVLANMEVEGFEHWEAVQGVLENGAIACTAHFGNFERFGSWAKAMGQPITVVAREANQGPIQERMEELRKMAGIDFMGRGDAVRPIMKKLREGKVVGLLPDQNSGESFLPFFGHPCGTVLGPAVLHIRTGAVMLPAFCVRLGVGRYRVIIKPAIDIERQERNPEALMSQYNAVLESVIRQFPEQYLWMHDRWKSARQKGLL